MEIIYLSLHCRHQNDFCIKMGRDESHFNVSVASDGQSHRTVSTNHNLFEEKGEPTPYRLWAKLAVAIKVSTNASESAQTLAVVVPVRAKATELGQH